MRRFSGWTQVSGGVSREERHCSRGDGGERTGGGAHFQLPLPGTPFAAWWLQPPSAQALGMTAEVERDFIKLDLGPALNNSAFGDVEIIILDDQKVFGPQWARIVSVAVVYAGAYGWQVLADATVRRYVAGIGIHWYWDFALPNNLLTITRNLHPEKFILGK